MELAKDKRFYGTVTVSERGQIVIPAQARRDLGIEPGEKLLVLADLEKGLVLTKASIMARLMTSTLEGVEAIRDVLGVDLEDEATKGD